MLKDKESDSCSVEPQQEMPIWKDRKQVAKFSTTFQRTARGFNLERGRRQVPAPTGREREARPASAAPPGHAPSRLSPPTAEGCEGAATAASVRGGGAHSPAGRGGAAGVSASAVARAQAPAPSTAAAAPGPSPTTTPPSRPSPRAASAAAASVTATAAAASAPAREREPARESESARAPATAATAHNLRPRPAAHAQGSRRTGARTPQGRGWALEGVAPPLARLPTRSLGWLSCPAAGSAELLQCHWVRVSTTELVSASGVHTWGSNLGQRVARATVGERGTKLEDT
ncbi:nematocyst expressed protein 3-like [Pan troglodytes]|uniref:nematocyst expressed protein 3-like n=1 Tax=Pan troglodytes TaxID=9598 RepID=UPI003013BB89